MSLSVPSRMGPAASMPEATRRLERAALDVWRTALRASEAPLTGGRIGDKAVIRRVAYPLRDAALVTHSARLLGNELLGRRTVTAHRLRGTELVVHLRHPHRDIWVLDEIFGKVVYAPPGPVRQTLASLGRPLRILDVGGHVGLAALYFIAEFPGASVTSVEPDPNNASVLRRTIEANGLGGRWSVIEAAAGVREGTVDFVSDFHLSRIGVSDHPATTGVRVRMIDLLPAMAGADLLKLDMQGGEWEVLADHRARSAAPRAIVLEYHPAGAPTPDTHSEARRLLEAAGYRVGQPTEVHAGEGTVWAWRPGDAARP